MSDLRQTEPGIRAHHVGGQGHAQLTQVGERRHTDALGEATSEGRPRHGRHPDQGGDGVMPAVAVEAEVWAKSAAEFLPPAIVDLLVNLFAGIRAGDNAHLSHGVTEALGRPPRWFIDALG